MKHSVERTDSGLRITAAVADDKQPALLEEFNKCASGTCSCPTPQYGKLQAVDIQARPGVVSVVLTARPGEVIDAEDIAGCLDHTAKQIGA